MRDQTVHFVGQIPNLGQLGNNLENYQHSDKLVTPGRDLSLANAYLKWYNISRREVTMSSELIQEGRTFLQAEVAASQLNLDGQFGFVERFSTREKQGVRVLKTQSVDHAIWAIVE